MISLARAITRSQKMKDEIKNEGLPPDFIEGIQKNIDDVIKARKKQKKVIRSKIDWLKIKESVDLLRLKCADFSRKIEYAQSVEAQNELARQANEIRNDWLDICAMMNGEK
jgi:hypothetical protein